MAEATTDHLLVLAGIFGGPLLFMAQRLFSFGARIAVLEAKQDMIPQQLDKLTLQVEALCKEFHAFAVAHAGNRHDMLNTGRGAL